MFFPDIILCQKNNSKIIIRITGDCPIVDPKIVDEFVKNFKKSQVDYLSNTNPGPFLMDLMLKFSHLNCYQTLKSQ